MYIVEWLLLVEFFLEKENGDVSCDVEMIRGVTRSGLQQKKRPKIYFEIHLPQFNSKSP